MNYSTHIDNMDWIPGHRIFENYIVRNQLGRGGFGTVYLVEAEQRPGTFFAVKTLRYQKGKMIKNAESLLGELQAWSDIPPHPNIVSCRFFRSIGRSPVIFSEYVDGGTLGDWIRKEKIHDLAGVLDIAIQIVEGLRIAHNRELIHQDIKPANIMMTADGCAKITDFGLACYSVSDPSDTPDPPGSPTDSGRTYKGLTPLYCSPEQAARADVDHRSDIWSWALVVIEMLRQESPPWTHGSLAGCWFEQTTEPAAHNRFHGPDLPALWELLGKCLKENPEDRPADGHVLQERLLAIYRSATGADYPGRTLDIDPQLAGRRAEFSRRTLYTGADWQPPAYYLQKVCDLIHANPETQVRIPPVTGNTRRACMLAEVRGFRRVMDWISAVRGYVSLPAVDILFIQLLLDCSQLYFDLDDNSASIEILDQAVRILESDSCRISGPAKTNLMISIAINQAESFRVNGKFDDARAILSRLGAAAGLDAPDANSQWHDAGPGEANDNTMVPDDLEPLQAARYYRVWGNIYMGLQKYDLSLARFRKALRLMEKYDLEDTGDDNYRRTMCLQAIGMMLSNLGRPLEARDTMEQVVALSRSWDRSKTHNLYCLAVIHANMGNLMNKLNHPDALRYLQNAVEFAEEQSREDVRFVRLQTRTMLSMAGYYSRNLDYAASLKTLKRLIDLLDRQIYSYGHSELMLEQMAVSNNLVAVLLKLQRFDDAIRAVHHGCRLAEHLQRAGQRDDVLWLEMVLRFNMVSALTETGQYETALVELDRVIAYREEAVTGENRKNSLPSLANACNQKSTILSRMKRFQEALEASKRAVACCEVIDETSNWDHMIIKIGILETHCNCLYDLGLHKGIEEVVDRALQELDGFNRRNEREMDDIKRAELELYKADCLIRRGERDAGLRIALRISGIVNDEAYHLVTGIGRKIEMARQIIEMAG